VYDVEIEIQGLSLYIKKIHKINLAELFIIEHTFITFITLISKSGIFLSLLKRCTSTCLFLGVGERSKTTKGYTPHAFHATLRLNSLNEHINSKYLLRPPFSIKFAENGR
jgi:hypothetical protein